MSNGFEEAQDRRNWLEKLGNYIPGFKGFQNRELRRDVDKMQREHLTAAIGRMKASLRDKATAYTDAGRIDALTHFDRLDRRLDGLSQSIRFTDYGNSGFFDPVKIYDEELDKLYRFDLSLLEDLAALEAGLAAVPLPGSGDPQEALLAASKTLDEIETKWGRRKEVISGVVQTSRG